MTALVVFLLIVVIVLLIIIGVQQSRMVITKRKAYILSKDIAKEREATADILNLSKEVINTGLADDKFLPSFVKYALRTLKGNGAAVFECRDDGCFYGLALAGNFPPVREVTEQVEQQLMAHEKRHNQFFRGLKINFTAEKLHELCGEKGFAFFREQSPVWFPKNFVREAPRLLIAPIKVMDETAGCLAITSKNDFDSPKLRETDGYYLIRLNEIASLCLEVLKVFKERKEYEDQIQSAREEGMMQVSTGIIHNIGNAVTIAKLTVSELKEHLFIPKAERPETLILDEMLPKMKDELEKGNLQQFLKENSTGNQYFDILDELMKLNQRKTDDCIKHLESLQLKLFHISEIIELQQRFVGELGTENMTNLANVLDASTKIFEETFNKRNVEIKTFLDKSIPEILIDSSMMTQVFINLIKNAVEAMDRESDPDKKYCLEVAIDCKKIDGEAYIVAKVSDNGPGIEDEVKRKVFNFGFTTKTDGSSRGFGLHSCVDTVKKYGGEITVDTNLKKGTAFIVTLPLKRKSPEESDKNINKGRVKKKTGSVQDMVVEKEEPQP